MTSTDRLLQFIEKQGISKRQFYMAAGLSNGYLDKTKNVSSDTLEKLLYAYPNLNTMWVITGKGEMLINENNNANTRASNDAVDIQKEGVNANTPMPTDTTDVKNIKKLDPPTDPPTPFFSPKYVTVNRDGTENILFVPIPAAAGYLNGYQDMVYLETLPAFNFPQLKNGTFRAFEVIGDSMFPTLENKEMVIGQYVEKLEYVREDRVHIVVTKKDGIVVKRLSNRIDKYGYIIAKSDAFDNRNSYQNFEIYPEDIIEIWYAVWHGKTSFKSPNEINKRINNIEADLTEVMRVLKTNNLLP